jgi:hypothetical protein
MTSHHQLQQELEIEVWPRYGGVVVAQCNPSYKQSGYLASPWSSYIVLYPVDRSPDLHQIGVGVTLFRSNDRASNPINEGVPIYFRQDEIVIDDTRMTCLARPHWDCTEPTVVTQGFSVVVTPAMAAELRAWIPHIYKLSATLNEVMAAMEQHWPSDGREEKRLYPHERSMLASILANMMLDGKTLGEAENCDEDYRPVPERDKSFLHTLYDANVQRVIAKHRKEAAPFHPRKQLLSC